MIPLLVAGGAYLLGKGIESWTNAAGANKAAQQQIAAGRDAQQQIRDYSTKAAGYQEPYYQQGVKDYETLGNMVRGGQFGMQDYNFQADPGYQFRLQQGSNSINASAASRGTGLSGATLKALQRYGQNFASNEYNNAYNRAYQQKLNNYDQWNNLAGYGTSAAANLSNIATSAGNQIAGLTTDIGNARASGTMGQYNAGANFANAVGNTAGTLMMNYPQNASMVPQNASMVPIGQPKMSLNNNYYDPNLRYG